MDLPQIIPSVVLEGQRVHALRNLCFVLRGRCPLGLTDIKGKRYIASRGFQDVLVVTTSENEGPAWLRDRQSQGVLWL